MPRLRESPDGRSGGGAGTSTSASAESNISGSGAPILAATPPLVLRDANLGFGVVDRLVGAGGVLRETFASGCSSSWAIEDEESSVPIEGS